MRHYKSFSANPFAKPKSKYKSYDMVEGMVTMYSEYDCTTEYTKDMVWLTAPNGDEIEIDIRNDLVNMGVNDEGFVQFNGTIFINEEAHRSYVLQCEKGYQIPIASAFFFANVYATLGG